MALHIREGHLHHRIRTSGSLRILEAWPGSDALTEFQWGSTTEHWRNLGFLPGGAAVDCANVVHQGGVPFRYVFELNATEKKP